MFEQASLSHLDLQHAHLDAKEVELFRLIRAFIALESVNMHSQEARRPVKQKLVASLASLCREMDMTIVTEGVETVGQRDTLIALGCDLLQGYLFAKPDRPFPEPRW